METGILKNSGTAFPRRQESMLTEIPVFTGMDVSVKRAQSQNLFLSFAERECFE